MQIVLQSSFGLLTRRGHSWRLSCDVKGEEKGDRSNLQEEGKAYSQSQYNAPIMVWFQVCLLAFRRHLDWERR
jgi:hypothetical protein